MKLITWLILALVLVVVAIGAVWSCVNHQPSVSWTPPGGAGTTTDHPDRQGTAQALTDLRQFADALGCQSDQQFRQDLYVILRGSCGNNGDFSAVTADDQRKLQTIDPQALDVLQLSAADQIAAGVATRSPLTLGCIFIKSDPALSEIDKVLNESLVNGEDIVRARSFAHRTDHAMQQCAASFNEHEKDPYEDYPRLAALHVREALRRVYLSGLGQDAETRGQPAVVPIFSIEEATILKTLYTAAHGREGIRGILSERDFPTLYSDFNEPTLPRISDATFGLISDALDKEQGLLEQYYSEKDPGRLGRIKLDYGHYKSFFMVLVRSKG